MTYTVTKEKSREFAGIFLLERMVNTPRTFPLLLDGDDTHLEELLTWLMSKDYVEIKDESRYAPTQKGREVVVRFKRRYQDFLKNFDIYCAVDLEAGEFAFEKFWDYEDETAWCNYLEEDRWEDLRVAVAAFKKLDPVEIVFMGFINEGRFRTSGVGWQFDLLLGSTWDDILEVCNTALTVDDLGYENDEGEFISGEAVLKDVISQGAELNMELWKEEAEMEDDEDDAYDDGRPPERPVVREVVVEEIHHDVYHGYYHDPFYISPVWLAVLLI